MKRYGLPAILNKNRDGMLGRVGPAQRLRKKWYTMRPACENDEAMREPIRVPGSRTPDTVVALYRGSRQRRCEEPALGERSGSVGFHGNDVRRSYHSSKRRFPSNKVILTKEVSGLNDSTKDGLTRVRVAMVAVQTVMLDTPTAEVAIKVGRKVVFHKTSNRRGCVQ